MNQVLGQWVDETLNTLDQSISTIFTSLSSEMHNLLGGFQPLESAFNGFFTCVVGNVTKDMSEIKTAISSISIQLVRIQSSDFSQFDAAPLFSQSLRNMDTSTNAFLHRHLDDFVDGYKQFIQIQSIPFIVLLLFGGSVLLIGLFFVCFFKKEEQADLV
jgi:hypothetical protein